jgi:AcrR family transcriptional regulator
MAANLRKDAVRSRRSILDAARELYRDDFEASFAEIAQEAGVGQATVYRHFADRRSLLAALADEDTAALEERIASGEEIGPGSLEDLLREVLAVQLRSQGMIGAIRAGEMEESRVQGLTDRVRDLFAPRLAAAREAGVVRPDLTVDDLLMVLSMVDGALAPLSDFAERERASARAFEIALDGLRVRA